MFEPGTGEVFDIPVTIEDFHNVEIVEYHEDSLASEFLTSGMKTGTLCIKTQ